MSRRKHCHCDNCCGRNDYCGGLASFPNLLYGLGLGGSPFNGYSDNSLLMLLLLSSLMKKR